jgi:hypothetical protein
MPAREDCEACIACGKSRAVLVVIIGRRGEYLLCSSCYSNQKTPTPAMIQRTPRAKKAKR